MDPAYFPVIIAIGVIVVLTVFFHYVPFFLWLSAKVSGVRISLYVGAEGKQRADEIGSDGDVVMEERFAVAHQFLALRRVERAVSEISQQTCISNRVSACALNAETDATD